jgi:Kef-type K+ transport system membrane component KefB
LKNILYIVAVVEVLGGLTSYFSPGLLFFSDLDGMSTMLCKCFGIAIVFIGLMAWKLGQFFDYSQASKQTYLFLLSYQVLIGFTAYAMHSLGYMHVGGCILHILLATTMMLFYIKDSYRFVNQP